MTILLPNYHVAQPLAQALGNISKSTLLLPNLITLNDWAQSVPLDAPINTDSQRSALLYQQLRKQKWFEQADLWSMTQELLTLFDDLTRSLNELPHDAEAFAAAVQLAYQARQNDTLQLEARLVFELWHAMQSSDELGGVELDGARAYQLRLAKLAAQAHRPLYVLRTSDWNALEQRFLDEYSKHAPVEVFDLRDMAHENDADGSIHFPFVLSAAHGAVYRRSERKTLTTNGSLKFFAATSLEQEARAAAMQVRRWLQAGKHDIAIVAQDRVVARRMRALLERAEASLPTPNT